MKQEQAANQQLSWDLILEKEANSKSIHGQVYPSSFTSLEKGIMRDVHFLHDIKIKTL